VYKLYKGKLPTKKHNHVRLVFQMMPSSTSPKSSKMTKRSEMFDVDDSFEPMFDLSGQVSKKNFF